MSAGGGRPPARSRPDFPGDSGAESSVLGVRFGERPPRAVCLLCAFTPRPRDPSQRPLTATVWAQRTSGCQRLRFLRPLCGPFVSSWALGFFKAFAPSSSLRCGFFSKATPEGRQPVGFVRLLWSHRSWFPAGHLPWACVHVLSRRPVPVVGGVLTPTGEVQSGGQGVASSRRTSIPRTPTGRVAGPGTTPELTSRSLPRGSALLQSTCGTGNAWDSDAAPAGPPRGRESRPHSGPSAWAGEAAAGDLSGAVTPGSGVLGATPQARR